VLLDHGKGLADNAEQISKPDKPFDEWDPPSLAEVDKFICWAKEHIDIEIDSFTWDSRVGATNIVFGHYKEAIVALEKAEQHSQTHWGLFFNLANAHENEKNYRTALKYIQDFKSLSSLFLETDGSYKTAYWELLLAEGNCHRQCREYDLAVKSFQDLLGQDINEESGMRSFHLDALSELFTTWSETKSYQSIIDFVRNWKDAATQSRGPIYWLRRAAHEDGIHTSIIVAAKHTGAVEDIISLYQEAIDFKPLSSFTVDEQGVEISAQATEQLHYFQAVLRFHGSRSRDDQHRSLQYWEEVVQRSDGNPALYFTAWKANRRLAPTLLDNAVAELPTASSSFSGYYISRLEKFANSNSTVICDFRQGSFDPRLCLARLYWLKKDHTSACMQAQARLCSVFDKWPEDTDDSSLRLRFSNLAQTLTVLDKDVDAVAAWQAIKPYQLSHASVADADVPSTGELTQPSSEVLHTHGLPATSDKEFEDSPDTSSLATITTKAYLSGYSCDGECGTEWKDVLADCYVCKHCLCVQFCSGCYKKLLADDLHPLICNKDHKMLFLPPFDWKIWRTMPADMVIVEKQLVPRLEWIDGIRKEFNVQQEQIDFIKMEKARELKAASIFAVQWRNRLQRIRAKKLSTAPTLRRAKTVG
jgi:tetratricopeptide (TPR) repeat protein